MRIGITVNHKHSVFSAGAPTMSLTIAEVYSYLSHTVTFIRIPVDDTDPLWWDDIQSIKNTWKSIHCTQYKPENFDIVFEIENCFLPETARTGSTSYIWIARKSPLFHDIEKCVTPYGIIGRNLRGITETWMLKELVSTDDIEYIELMTRKPVRVLPYVWSPLSIEIYNKDTSSPIWHQTRSIEKPYLLTICEKNTTSTSSCTIPLMAVKQIVEQASHPLEKKVLVINGNQLKESKFFTENVLHPATAAIPTMTVALEGRCRIPDLCKQQNTVVIGHSRFVSFRGIYLDCLWVGIPLVHNIKMLCDLGEYVSQGYYENNNILGAADAFKRIVHASKTYTHENLLTLRKEILQRFGLLSETIKTEWETAIQSVKSIPLTPTPLAPTPLTPTPLAPTPLASTPLAPTPLAPTNTLRVGFCDMWEDFNASYNFFTLLLTNHLAQTNIPTNVVGIDITDVPLGSENVDILFFGPFGSRWTNVHPSVPKIHYTGENTPPVVREDVLLNLGYHHSAPGIEYVRLPLWVLEIDWFNADPSKIVNPKPIPLSCCTKVDPSLINSKSRFCAFIVSNPTQPVRNNAFKTLTTYKHIDSAGRLFNNVGDFLAAGAGGGGGELKKHQFLKSYKFSITYENAKAYGYTTEKLLHAKAAGCIPIYWGDPYVEADFNMEGCIDARECKSEADLIKLVKDVDTNDTLWRKKASTPALDEVRLQKTIDLLKECSIRILSLCPQDKLEAKQTKVEAKVEPKETKVDAKVEPKEAKEAKEAKDEPNEAKDEPKEAKDEPKEAKDEPKEAKDEPKVEKQGRYASSKIAIEEYDVRNNSFNTCFITACNLNFFESLMERWLPCIEAYRKLSDKIHAVVGLLNLLPFHGLQIRTKYPWVKLINIPTDTLPNFPDCWNPQHFLWKLWMYKECVTMPELDGSLCIYIDTGILVSRWPTLYARNALLHGISVLSDHTQINKHWCHSVFTSKLNVTEKELAANQLVGGICAFVGGNATAKEYFTKAYEYGTIRDIIVGDKWTGVGTDGKPYGHRHDQSILSILSLRMNLHRTSLYTVYNDVSLRNTFLQKKAFYVYRSLYREHAPCVEGIDDIWLINLDRREDRLADFNAKHPDIENRVIRIPAIDGKQLTLTPNIARLFAPMAISTWMKGAMGCAMTHMIPWLHLANDKSDVNSYLILEDDVVLHPGWKDAWATAYQEKCIPEDYDVVYLGGILPPNRGMFETMALKMINEYVGKIKPNTFFGQATPNTYFHVCACAYVLSKRGAAKLLKILEARQGCFAHLDHVICGSHDSLNIYFLYPLVAHAKQDSDPVYAKSQFNNLTAVEGYDSDIRDGSVFSKEEIESIFDAKKPLNILAAIMDAREGSVKPEASRRILSYGYCLCEKTWIMDVLFKDTNVVYETLPDSTEAYPLPDDTPIVVYTLANSFKIIKMLQKWSSAGKTFYVLHIGDAACLDPIDMYELKGCLGVVRNYAHDTLSNVPRILTVPLGYQFTCPTGSVERDLAWSFFGTNWHNRKDLLKPFLEMPGKHHVLFLDDWASPSKLKPDEMFSYMKRSMFVPCPAGENAETFRMYEALEAGAIPVLVRDSNKKFIDTVTANLPLKVFDAWDDAALIVYAMSNNPTKYNEYRSAVLSAWDTYKKKVATSIKDLFQLESV